MQSKLSCFVLGLLLVSACAAQAASTTVNVRPTSETQCTGTGLKWAKDLATNYRSTAVVDTAVCVFSDYEEACPTLKGVVACDTTVNSCKKWGSDAWKKADTDSVWVSTTDAPSVCFRHGTLKFNPDQGVLIVVQPLISSLVFIGLAVAAILVFRGKVHFGSIAIVIMMCIIGIIQTVSYYYLNAYIVIAAGLIALAAYAQKKPVSVGFGMFVLLGAFFWVTFDTGLGQVQHHSRWTASSGPAIQDTYELKCNQYYNGFFTFPRALMSESDNIQSQYRGYCLRPFLAAQLFLMIVQEYFLILLIAMGAFALTEPAGERALKTETTETF